MDRLLLWFLSYMLGGRKYNFFAADSQFHYTCASPSACNLETNTSLMRS
ncbi:hypothetical protein C7460_10442 [Marinoscillum furvescens DSM 4134]|uniref:Uncharacterized protein n=1 Tax=Marinoscillum furvescens DSM 4134 TaxID=1122208 RepID=A0A3D9L4S7_MARFU|nr:hypothetical protein C7460_10442 [Marinoscillum furvescens DSM 4134]